MIVKRTLAIILFLLALAVPCSASMSAPWFSENFDSYNLGYLNGQGGWFGNNDPLKIEQTFVVSGKAFEANYQIWGDTGGSVSHNVTSGTGYQYIDMDVAMDITRGSTGSEGMNLGYIYIQQSSSVEITRLYMSDNQFKIRTYDSQPVIKTPVPNRTWIHVTFMIDLASSKMDVWVDGVQVLEQQQTVAAATTIGQITLGQWNRVNDFTKSETYIDNLVCKTYLATGWTAIGPYTGWERSNVAYPAVMYDSSTNKYNMYYAGSAGPWVNDSAWGIWHTGLAQSTDAYGFSRVTERSDPVLMSTKFYEGDLLNPQDIANRFDSVWAIGPSVIKDGSTYKMWYTGWSGETEHIGGGVDNKINYRIGYATSTDGKVWTKYTGSAGANSIFGLGAAGSQDAKGVGQPFVLKEGSTYRMWYEGFDGSLWRIFYATSSNGITWTRQGVALSPGGSGALDQYGARNPVVIFRNSQYELWYQGKSVSYPCYHVLRATSPNGITWTKVPAEVVFSPADMLDSDEDIYVDSVVVRPDNYCIAYFAKQNTSSWVAAYETIKDRKSYIMIEVVNP
ncbi:MAG: hypothetical protein Q7N50_11945 [Armatimonadota bacterium]|nr:hypothetical protein [Armatimonadota bacterium]